MIYRQLFDTRAAGKRVRVGVIGTGQYATAIVTQSPAIPRLEVAAVCDLDLEAARRAFRRAGIADEACALCDSREAALRAIERGRRVIAADASLLMELPLDVIVESTGVSEAGARHAWDAIRHGKHVAMVTKETDAAVGPILKYLADRAGVVYTAVDGDQHGLLIALVAWARALGLEVLCGGKALAYDLVLDPATRSVTAGRRSVVASTAVFQPLAPGRAAETVRRRREALGRLGAPASYDVIEMTIAANATGLAPDVAELHGPALRIREIPEALCPEADGGVLGRRGAIEAVACLRAPDGAGLSGGVFIVVACDNAYSRSILTTKELITNARGTAALIYRPYHLCGVETPISLLCAGLLGLPTGATDYAPRFDVVARAAADLRVGHVIGEEESHAVRALMRPARAIAPDAPLPLPMALGNPLTVDLPTGSILTAGMVRPPADSRLWALRAEQDRRFLAETPR